ncbi:FeoA family protein [Agaribacterium haliotis]|uniref:FeoA family protein n=1 Tax=Agaribacterium haliotis TaxID=2013869 RepID=UPI000BB53CE8|nr:FeoA family protein [Agaribacterium haliotis]
MTLADLKHGSNSLISNIDSSGEAAKRLSQLGVIPGAEVRILRAAPLGDPMQVRVDNTVLSIRKRDAAQIQVEQV